MIFVLYHASCTDGAGAKWATWKKFGDNAKYIPVQYNKPYPEELDAALGVTPDLEVYILDFSYNKKTLEHIKALSHKLVVLDHHKTAKEDLQGLDYAVFDMEKSGAVMAWEWFHPDTPVPQILLHVQDRDLWKFEMEHTKELHEFLNLDLNNMQHWNYVDNVITNRDKDGNGDLYKLMINAGGTIMDYVRTSINKALGKIRVIDFEGYKVGIANVVNNISETGTAIYSSERLNVDFSMTYFIENDGRVVFSLRSKGDMDVSAIARKYGGGGHKNACGFSSDLETLSKILKG